MSPFGQRATSMFPASFLDGGTGALIENANRWSHILHDTPPQRFERYDGVGIPGTIKLMTQAALGPRGEQHSQLKQLVHEIISDVKAKDYVSEAIAVWQWTCKKYHYIRDNVHVEYVQDPIAFAERGFRGDCDCVATFIAACCQCIGNPVRFVTGGFVRTPEPSFTHVWTEAFISRLGCWVTLDPVAGNMTDAMLAGCVWRCNYPIDGDMGRIETVRCR